jgi:hypothetical protein
MVIKGNGFFATETGMGETQRWGPGIKENSWPPTFITADAILK